MKKTNKFVSYKIITVFIVAIVILFVFQIKTVLAIESNTVVDSLDKANSLRMENKVKPEVTKTTATPSANKVENLKQRANAEIERRITSLNKLIEKINALKKLSDTQKATFISQIQEEITSLTNLKVKINADSDLATLKTDVKSIVQSYRIYLLFIPKINVLVAADSLDALADKMSSLAAKLELRINTSGDVDVTKLKTTLEDMKAKIADSKVQAQKARDAVISLTPEGYPGNKGILQQGREYIVAGKKDIRDARQDAMIIIQGLKGIQNLKTSTPSAE